MRSRSATPLRSLIGFGVGLCLAACTSGETASPFDDDARSALEPAGAETTASAEAALSLTPQFFAVTRDVRRCASPLCGGFFVKAVNRANTRCADGSIADRCYVAEIDTSAFGRPPLGWTDEAVLRGRIESNVFPEFGDLGRFVAAEAWDSATLTPGTGAFFRLTDNGIRCITSPCFNLEAELLNFGVSIQLSGLDLSGVGATPEQIASALDALAQGDLIAAGRLRLRALARGIGLELASSQFYLPLAERCYSDTDCATGERCNAAEICLPPPGCDGGGACPAVCTGYCVASEPPKCSTDADCAAGSWCRETQSGSFACVPFAGEGDSCGGFVPVWLFEQCSPELVCDYPELVVDAPGICRRACSSNSECGAAEYCATDSLCHADGTCDLSVDCNSPGNDYPHIECVGHPYCPGFGSGNQCGWSCEDPRCLDLYRVDFGPCDAVLGWAPVNGTCTQLSGCSAESYELFATQAECASACTLP